MHIVHIIRIIVDIVCIMRIIRNICIIPYHMYIQIVCIIHITCIILLLQDVLLRAAAGCNGSLQTAACLEQYILLQLQAAACRLLL